MEDSPPAQHTVAVAASGAETEVLRRVRDDALAAQARAEAEVSRLKLDINAGQAALLQLGEEADKANSDAQRARNDLAAVKQEVGAPPPPARAVPPCSRGWGYCWCDFQLAFGCCCAGGWLVD